MLGWYVPRVKLGEVFPCQAPVSQQCGRGVLACETFCWDQCSAVTKIIKDRPLCYVVQPQLQERQRGCDYCT